MEKPPTKQEDAVKSIKNGKAHGIPSEVYKFGGPCIIQVLCSFFPNCWGAAELPQEFQDAMVATILLSVVTIEEYPCSQLLVKLANILLARLQHVFSKILPESQCGFRASRSPIDPIFTLRIQLQEKSIEQLYMVSIDFTKAFDTIDRELLWTLLDHEFHDGMQTTFLVDGDTSKPFPVCRDCFVTASIAVGLTINIIKKEVI
ncbi:uncharacterized protein [Amphiura filiformis]|uniref:uncharacterized protein n=1 Tax=Amphiura filiformis TaxID=82378 RepID=UPI003B21E7C0